MAKQHEKHSKVKHHEHPPKTRPIHKDWRAWLVVGLMIAAMVIYILSLDESFWPGEDEEEPRTPAIAE